jgi:hypothetical protein
MTDIIALLPLGFQNYIECGMLIILILLPEIKYTSTTNWAKKLRLAFSAMTNFLYFMTKLLLIQNIKLKSFIG